MRRYIVWTFIVVLSCTALFADYAGAAPRNDPSYGKVLGYVTAESRYGNGITSGPVRRGPRGRLEVGLARDTWIECGRSCSDTLRRNTVDFWNGRGGRHADDINGPGYFSFYFYY
jgi:hypothetical protein